MSDQPADATTTSQTKTRKPANRKSAPDTKKKRAFVLSKPAEMPATEIAKAARKTGLTMSEKFVYRVRRDAKTGTAPKATPTVPKKTNPTPKARTQGRAVHTRAPHAPGASSSVDEALLALALEHGLVNVVGAIERLRANAGRLLASISASRR